MTERDGAAMRVDEIGIVLDGRAGAGRLCPGWQGFIELDQIEIGYLQAQPLIICASRHRTDAMMRAVPRPRRGPESAPAG